MKVLVAGSSGVIGRQAVALLTEVGHDVVELVRPRRSPGQAPGPTSGRTPERVGPDVAVADALDAAAVRDAVGRAEPDAVVDLLTAIPRAINPRRMARDMALTNRLRTEGLANLIAAAPDARFVVESLAYAYAPTGGILADEDQPLWVDGPRQFRPVAHALVEHERLAGEVDAAVLRFGHLYGPGSSYADDGSFVEQLRAGKVPIVGDGGAVFSFTHAHDAATAVVAALDKSFRGVLNVVDDDPAPLHTWLPQLADIVGAPAPKTVPKAMARMAVGGWGVAFMTALPGADNSRARLNLDWRPGHPSWRKGFEHELRDVAREPGVDL